jgi:hypothetical protein
MLNDRERKKGVKKQLGHTYIEVNNEVHMFVVGDQDPPQIMEIHAELQRLSRLMHDAGMCHGTIAFGLINTAPDTPL